MVDRILCEWMPMMPSCHLTCYADGVVIGGVSIRPDVPLGANKPDGWQRRLLDVLADAHGKDVPLDMVQKILPSISQLHWSDFNAGIGAFELSGRGEGYWLAFSVGLDKFPTKLTLDEINTLKTKVQNLRDTLLLP